MRAYPPALGWVTEFGYRRFILKDRTRKFEHVLNFSIRFQVDYKRPLQRQLIG